MEGNYIKINKWLTPLSWLYGLGVRFRNWLFDAKILKSRSFETPVIAVGNITVGGTGKTPHVEYLVRLLHNQLRLAVLSRGYKRKSSGFLLATKDTPMEQIGDEPYQMKQKFPDVMVAVDKKRTRGISKLTEEQAKDKADAVVLDDAFQHRYVKPGLNILLVDYQRLIIYDTLLPAGRLREPLRGKDRADVVIVTKCPRDMKPMDFRVITKAMHLFPYQKLFFTTFEYEALRPLFPKVAPKAAKALHKVADLDGHNVLLLSGIASPRQLTDDVGALAPGATLHELTFPDHHYFTKKDITAINKAFKALPAPRCIVTTEKDATRIATVKGLSDEVRQNLYVLPIRIVFMLEQEQLFNERIIRYVRKNSRNRIVAEGTDANQSKDSHHPGDGSRTISFRNN